ncbi:Glycosyl transferase family 2 [uncultured archaeon]|nr:Glycosyl transferase family 2 [uncultured archaeon]
MEKDQLIKVDILIPAYNEPIDIIERMFQACHQQRRAGDIDIKVWFCIDGASENEIEIIKSLANKYNINISLRPNRKGFRAGALNFCIQNKVRADSKYLIVLDIDQAPKPEMAQILVEQMEKDENKNVQFIMFPQIASNSKMNTISKASDLLQMYDYYFNRRIRAKTNSAFVVGTNWIGHTEFVKKIPFEEESIVEDQASSIRWHANGAVVKVINAELALGLAPDTIDSWRAQQARWSYGAIYNLKFLSRYWKKLTFWQKIDYLSVMTWYLYSIPTIISILLPLFTFFKPITRADPIMPVVLLFLNIGIFTFPMIYCREPRLTIKEIFQTAAMQHMCLDLYLKSIYSNIIKEKFSYVVSDKTSKLCRQPHRKLWLPYLLVTITGIGIIIALYLNPPMYELRNLVKGVPLSYTTYIVIWIFLSIFWIWGTIFYTHKSNKILINNDEIEKTSLKAPINVEIKN